MTPRFAVTDPAGTQAAHIDSLWNVFLVVSIVVWSIVTLVMLAAAARAAFRRHVTGDGDPLVEDQPQKKRLLSIITGATVITVLTLMGLLFASIGTGDALAALDEDPHALHVKLTAHQWWWEVEYDADDPTKAVLTANELHVPVGRTVSLELVSQDVIHSFWVPSIHGKKDLIPGRTNRTAIKVTEPGIYRGQCAEFCGLEHARMQLRVIAESPAQFETWLAQSRRPAGSPDSDLAKQGQQLFMSRPCASCHAITGTPASGKLGPDLTHVASRLEIAATDPNTRGQLMGWIADPQGMKPGSRMPRIALSSDELNALTAYLESLK